MNIDLVHIGLPTNVVFVLTIPKNIIIIINPVFVQEITFPNILICCLYLTQNPTLTTAHTSTVPNFYN